MTRYFRKGVDGRVYLQGYALPSIRSHFKENTMKAYQHSVLTDYIKRAIASGTMQDAAIASKYLAQVTGKKYDLCASALHTKYGIRVCPKECAERSMWCAKDKSIHVGYDKAKTVWVKADVPAEAIANI